ncbi:hypothetical protein FIBSPDRAFT_957646 [Athelia psychrophila]|uniref:Uncharacterized protein n=1 Tax=Athelia psychrophila TaxID=1759441 RepID=A0A166FLR4_9AGAM|nr:hypothetical protein FIBSPDRAFT_957646 [Fibularhizoctonia sp. CBS 109695]
MAPRITRASNKDTHPGQIDAPRARKSAVEAQAECAAAAAIAATAATHELMKIQQVAALEAHMAAEDVTENANAARPVPRPSRNEVQAFRDAKIAALGKADEFKTSDGYKNSETEDYTEPEAHPPALHKAPKKAKPSQDLIMQEHGRQESESIKAGKHKAEDIETLSATKKSKHSFTPSGVRTSYKHRSQHGRQGSTISISSDSTPTLATCGKHALPLACSETYILVDNVKYRGLSDEDKSREQASKSAIKPVKAEVTPLKPLMAGISQSRTRPHWLSVPPSPTIIFQPVPSFASEATTNEDYIPELQSIWDTVFPDTPHTVASHGDAVYYVATQKLYEWRSHFAYVAHALGPGLPFRYLDEANKSGAFLSKLVGETFTSHIADTDSVPDAYKTDANPCSALVLSLTAVKRALSMTRTGKIVPSDKPSVGHFSELNWGHKTSLYVPSVAAITDNFQVSEAFIIKNYDPVPEQPTKNEIIPPGMGYDDEKEPTTDFKQVFLVEPH